MPHPTLQITPLESFIDESISIKVVDCKPYEKITVRAKATDDNGLEFASCAVFEANHHGKIDLSEMAPSTGSYKEIDCAGLFWSMERVDTKQDDYFTKASATRLPIDISIERKRKTLDSVKIMRKFFDESVKRETINSSSMTGVLYYPDTNSPYPGVLLLGGSDGGIQEHAAALLATKGYTVLSLAYFGVEGVPKDLEKIPLEYFKNAALWLKEHCATDNTVSLIGFSRGGELALLLGSTYSFFTAIIAGAPGAYVTSGLRNTIYAPIPSWTKDGEALPYLKFNHRIKTMLSMGKNWLLRRQYPFLIFGISHLRIEKIIAKPVYQLKRLKCRL
ncbi:acyl-CoA thioesterase/BAAT N-terminal domain-containing protein [Bacillus sp. JCM 19041]|uniref:acyl-CoA thioesterase/BAAT N-terminal domain-containing protein n=1 Tax=Bacillus sp. JCM 19041 TaxID=1460637 RepID=UPI0006D1CB85